MDLNLSKNSSVNFQGKFKSSGSSAAVEITLLVLVSVLFSWFVILPKKAELQSREKELKTLQEQQSQIAGQLETLRRLVQDLKSNQSKVALLDQSLPLDGKILRLRFLIETLANTVGVTVSSVGIASKSDLVSGDKALLANPFGTARTLQKLSGSVSVVGTFDQLEAFLKKLENSGRILDVGDLNLDANTSNNLNMRVTLSAYYLAP